MGMTMREWIGDWIPASAGMDAGREGYVFD
jgi:hypothetical protein